MKPLQDLADELGISRTFIYNRPFLKEHRVKYNGKYCVPDRIYEQYKSDILERRKLSNPKWINVTSDI